MNSFEDLVEFAKRFSPVPQDIRESKLPTRISNALFRSGIVTLGHLKTIYGLSGTKVIFYIRNIGEGSCAIIEEEINNGLLENVKDLGELK